MLYAAWSSALAECKEADGLLKAAFQVTARLIRDRLTESRSDAVRKMMLLNTDLQNNV